MYKRNLQNPVLTNHKLPDFEREERRVEPAVIAS